MGVTLYTFVTGNLPWIAEGTPALHALIKQQPVPFPPSTNVSPHLKRLLLRMLDKDHTTRITLPQIKVQNTHRKHIFAQQYMGFHFEQPFERGRNSN